jgi:hypothetical protein
MKKVLISLIIAGVIFQGTTLFLPAGIHRDVGSDLRLLGNPGLNLPMFQKCVLVHKPVLKRQNLRYFAVYHLWPVSISFFIFKPSHLIYKFFIFAYIMLFSFSFFRVLQIWFDKELAYIATIFALFSNSIADFFVLWNVGSIAFPFFAIYLLETRRNRRPYLCSFFLALSVYSYYPGKVVVVAYVLAFCVARWQECKKRPLANLFFFILIFPSLALVYFFPQEVPGNFLISFSDFLEKLKMVFYYRVQEKAVNTELGKRMVNPILSIGTAIYLLISSVSFLKKRGHEPTDLSKSFGYIFLGILLVIFLPYLYWIPYIRTRLAVWVLPSFFVFTALLIAKVRRYMSRINYVVYIVVPCLLLYVATEVPPHIKKITHPTISGYYCYGLEKIIPYLKQENPKKIFVDGFMSSLLRAYTGGALNIDKVGHNQVNSPTFPWALGTSFEDEAYFVFWNKSAHLKKLLKLCRKNNWECTPKKHFNFPEHKTGIKIYRVRK